MKQHLKPIMFVGTCSDAGKSVINAAFCRIFKQDGYQPAPFKAQNMSLNSFSTPETLAKLAGMALKLASVPDCPYHKQHTLCRYEPGIAETD